MTAHLLLRLITTLVLTLGLISAAHAAVPLAGDVELTANGGATFKAPDWKQTRKDAAVAVFERQADADKKLSFGVLVLAIEEGPKRIDKVDWDLIRDNVLKAAKDAGGELTLEGGDEFKDVEGLAGRRFTGIVKNGERESTVEMVALVGKGVMVTVTAIGPRADKGAAELALSVAATAALKTP